MLRGGHVTLVAKDVSASVRFYVETLGMKLVEERPDGAVIDAGGGLRLALSKEGRPADVTFYPKLPLDEAIAILENRGVVFDASTSFRDPGDNRLFLREPLSAPASSAARP